MSRLAMLAAPKIKQHRPSRVGEDRNGEHAARVRWRQPKQHRPSRVGEDRNPYDCDYSHGAWMRSTGPPGSVRIATSSTA